MASDHDLIIEPRRGKKEELLPEMAVLVLNPAEADSAFKHFKAGSRATKTLHQSCVQVDAAGRLCLAGPALGAAAAALLLEKMIVLGVRKVWLVSCCGVLDPALGFGDLLVGYRSVSGEGVSKYYTDRLVGEPGHDASGELRALAGQLADTVGDGVIWSTDAPYREQRSILIGLRETYGVNGVDMEFSALCAVAEFRGISLGGLFVVSDLLWTRNWKPGFGSAEFRKKNTMLIRRIIDFGLAGESR